MLFNILHNVEYLI